MAEPRKLTIKLRPVGAKAPAAGASTPTPAPVTTPPPTPAPAAEAPAPAVETPITEAPVPSTPAEAPTAPAVETPVEEPPKAAPAPVAEAPVTTPDPNLAKRQTARVQLPEGLLPTSEEKTIKLKPVSSVPAEPAVDQQAAKSKTARIALDSVLGGISANAPIGGTTQKTIKLKRAGGAPAVKPTASAPMPAVPEEAPAAIGGDDPAAGATIKLKRPGLTLKKPNAPAPKPTASDDGLESLDTLEPLEELPELAPLPPLPAEETMGAKILTIAAIAAAVVGIILTIVTCMVIQKQAASPDGSAPTGNTLHVFSFNRL